MTINDILKKIEKNCNINTKELMRDNLKIKITYHSFLSNIKLFNQYFIDRINEHNLNTLDQVYPGIYEKVVLIDESIIVKVNRGNILFIYNDYIYLINCVNDINRSITDSLIEPNNISGPRDGFVENYETNISLIQKRIKDSPLKSINLEIGKRGKTNVFILYIEDICNKKIITEVLNRLNKINTDIILSPKEIEYAISTNNLFPTTAEIGNPDIASMNLLEGRVIILIDQIPVAITTPVDFNYFITLKENNYTKPTMTLIYRLFFIFIVFLSTYFLGIYAALINFHNKNVSLLVISEIKSSLKGSTLPIFIEFIFILLLFDILRLAATKSPNISLQSIIATVGGILIGQNAVNSGFISSFNLVITAICYVSSYCISSNQQFINSLSILRLIILIVGNYFGLLGIVLAIIVSSTYLINLKSINTPYLSPIAPFYRKDFMQMFLSKYHFKKKTRNENLNTIDHTRGNYE